MAGLEDDINLFYCCKIDKIWEYYKSFNSEITKTKVCFHSLSKFFLHYSIYNMYDSDLYDWLQTHFNFQNKETSERDYIAGWRSPANGRPII